MEKEDVAVGPEFPFAGVDTKTCHQSKYEHILAFLKKQKEAYNQFKGNPDEWWKVWDKALKET
jgi:hypothetical protein